jgi:hypothetical protein
MADDAEVSRVSTLAILTPDHFVVGDILKWRRSGDVWEALITHEIDGETITEWLPALVLARQDAT